MRGTLTNIFMEAAKEQGVEYRYGQVFLTFTSSTEFL